MGVQRDARITDKREVWAIGGRCLMSENDRPRVPARGGLRGWFPHESGAVALWALAACAASIMVMAAVAWSVGARSARERSAARGAELSGVARTLGSAAEALLAEPSGARELSAFRRQMVEAATAHGIADGRLVLPNGQVVASSDPKSITLSALPERWDGVSPEGNGVWGVEIPGRGSAALVVREGRSDEAAVGDEWLIAATGGAVLVALMAMGQGRLRRRLSGLVAIRRALSAAAAGETDADVLTVAARFGPEAGAWNEMMAERRAAQEARLTARVSDRLAGGGADGDADLAGACDALWQGVVLVDEALRVSYLNGAAGVFLAEGGAKREELVGRSIEELLSEPRLVQAVRGAVEGRQRSRTVVELSREREKGESGESPERRGGAAGSWAGGVLRFTVRAVRREDAHAAIVVIEDVTQQRVADEARNAFVAQVTHELRSPLTSIRLYVEQLIDDDATEPAERAKALNVISQESRRLERIVGDMLCVSEIEAGSMRLSQGEVRVREMLMTLKEDYAAQALAKQQTLKFDLSPKLPVLQGDADKLGLAVQNLLGNAIKYTPAGGNVTLRADVTGTHLVLEFADNGIGIKEEEQGLIFDKFYRAKDKRLAGIAGSGLGLALAREVVRMHGGEIAVQSQIDKGSTFRLTLPLGGSAGAGGGVGGTGVVGARAA